MESIKVFNKIITKKKKNITKLIKGGLTREWITLLAEEMFNPNKGLFILSSNKVAVQPNPFSFIVPNHLNIFKFIGNFIGRVHI